MLPIYRSINSLPRAGAYHKQLHYILFRNVNWVIYHCVYNAADTVAMFTQYIVLQCELKRQFVHWTVAVVTDKY
jgi:hypothetical protein